MKLYHLTQKHCNFYEDLIIRAKDAKEARRLATKRLTVFKKASWMNPKITKCVRIDIDGISEVVFHTFS